MTGHHQLEQIICSQISAAGGFLPFDAFMQAALYAPELGYYEAKTVFGEAGDFVTASELGPWLSLGFADLIFNCWQQMGEPAQWVLLEQGSGSGKLLASVLDILVQMPITAPQRIVSVERSHALRERQRTLFSERGHVVEIHASLDGLDACAQAVLFSNELPDAFPVRCFRYQQGQYFERGVIRQPDGALAWGYATEAMQSAPEIPESVSSAWPEGYISEFNPGLAAWQQSLAGVMKRGFILTLDYGYARQEYYRPGRGEGTLLAHFEHTAVEEVLTEPGSRDITAHVDFSALAQAGREAGMQPLLWMSQGGWLAQSPSVQAFIQELAAQSDAQSMHLLAHAKRMLMPFGMGEVFKLLVQSVDVVSDKPAYLRQFDHLDQL